MREILLSQGLCAIVDDDEYEKLMGYYKWYACKNRHLVYAKCNTSSTAGNRTTLKMHRIIMNAMPGQVVDHINGNGLDNRKCNLRIVDDQKNAANRRCHAGSSSKYKGVAWHIIRRKWQVNICVNGKNIYLGLHENEVDAALTYDMAAMKYFGEFARLNFPSKKVM